MKNTVPTNKREIAFIDSNVDDLQTLLAGIRPDVEPILLANDAPAPRQMARVVRGRAELDAIHVVAHGRPGEVSFAAGALTLETLDECSGELDEIGRSLREGTIQLWSCSTGSGASGVAFVAALARATGAEVVAASGLVGAAARGGDWVLESPRLATAAVAPLTAAGQAAYAGLLDTAGNNGTNTLTAAASNSTITDGNGTNTVTVTGSNDKITDGNGTNTVTVTGNNDTITDGNGNNTIMVSGSNETITDGNGSNLIYAAGTTGTNSITDGNGSNVIVGGRGNDTITAGNGSSIIYGGAGNDTINVGNGNSVIMAGAGSDTINSGGGSDLAIYALSDHYKIVNGALQTIAGDIDVYKGGSGNDTIRIVVTADEYALIKPQLSAYASWSAANQGSNATYSFNFAAGTSGAGISTVGGGLSLNSWESLQVQVVNTGTVNLAPSATSATGSLNSLNLFNDTIGTSSVKFTDTYKIVGLAAGTGQIAASLDPSLAVAQYLHGTATLPTSYTVTGTDGTLTVNADGTYSYTVTTHVALSDTFTLTTLDQNGFVTSTTLTFGVPNHASELSTVTATDPTTIAELADASHQDLAPIHGTLTVTDLDAGNTLTASVVGSPSVTVSGGGTAPAAAISALTSGALSLESAIANGGTKTIAWTYDAAAANLDFLQAGQTLTVDYTVKVSDGFADSGTQHIIITITGTNDAAVLSAATANLTETNSATDISTSGTLTISDVDSPATFVAQAGTVGSYGTFAIGTDGAWTYTASSAHNEFVDGTTYTDTFDVASADGTHTAVTVNILGTNDAAVLSAATANLTETNSATDISTSGTLTISDVDSPATFVAQAGTVGSYGTFAIGTDGAWTYTASSAHNEFVDGTTYTDTFDVASADGTHTAVTVNILGTNDAAVLSAATANLTETNSATDISTSGTLTISDVDSPATFVAQAGTVGSYGTFAIGTDGAWTYTASSAHNEFVDGTTYTDTFDVASADGTHTAVTVNILGTNDAAVLSAATANLTETNSATDISTSGTLTISDVDSPATFVAQAGTVGSYGTFAIGTDGAWTYTASSAHNEFVDGTTYTDTFDVASADGTHTAVTVNILGTNDAAVLSAATANLTETNSATDISTSGTLTISDVDSPATFVAQAGTVGSYGTFAIGTDGAWTYTASSAHNEFVDGTTYTDTFDVASADGTHTAVTVNILGTNDAAVLSAATANLTETNSATDISTSGTLTISDVDSPATFVAQAGTVGSYGTFAIGTDGAWTYTASSAHNEFVDGTTYTDTFDVASADGTHTAVTVNILGTNDAAVLSAATANLTETNSATDISTSGTLTISDVDSPATFVAQAGTVGSYGTFAIGTDGAWTYTASSAHNEFVDGTTYTDTFDVASADGTHTAVTVNILGTNDAAVLSAATANLTETNSATDISTSGTLTISDVDSPATFVAQAGTVGSYGTFAIGTDGAWTYTASSAHNEFVDGTTYTDTFDVASADGTHTAVTVNILGTNDAAVLSAATANLTETNSATDISTSGTLTISDVDSPATFVAQAGTVGSYGTFAIGTDGAWTYTASSAHNEFVDGTTYTDTFDVASADGTHTAVTVNILGTNDAPVGVNDTSASAGATAATEKGGTNNGSGGNNAIGNVLTNDTDVDSGSLTVTAIRTGGTEGAGTAGTVGSGVVGAHGTLTLNSNGSYIYVVNEADGAVQALNTGGSITDTFNYTVSDGSLTDTAVLIVTINGANDAPTITSGATASTPENVSTSTAVYTAAATDPEGTTLTYSFGGGVDDGKFNINSSTGAVTFKASPDFETPTDTGGNNVYDIIVKASDGSLFDTKAVAITVSNVAPAAAVAIIAISTDSTDGGAGHNSDFITNDTSLTISGTNGALSGGDTVQVSNDGGATWHNVTQNTATTWGYVDPTTHTTSFTYQARVINSGEVGNTDSHAVTIDTTADTVANHGALAVSGTGTHSGSKVLTETVIISGIDSDIASGTITISDTHGDTATHTLTPSEISTATSSPTGSVTVTSWVNLDTLKANDTLTAAVSVNDLAGNTANASHTVTDPAGSAGQPINLALTDPTSDYVGAITATISGVPSGWTLSEGTNNGDGSWTVVTNDVSSLSITSPTNYTGALVLNVAETWTNADGSTGHAVVADNVEVYAPGSPIFALSGDDNLTGSSGHDLFVFSQPIGHDVIHSFDAASDQIDLIGYTDFSGFGDIQAHMTNDAAGNAVIALADGQSITLNGVDASSLTASDFVFDQTPVTENAGNMTISDGAMLPLSGEIHNSGVIQLNSTGDETDLQLIEHGITLEGSGQVVLSDNAENVIMGTAPDVTLTNVDNVISGAGQLGNGQITLVNEGTINATGNNPLIIDTGVNAVENSGTLEAVGSGGLEIHSDVVNSGLIWANGGNIKLDGSVTGSGAAVISDGATLEFAGLVAEDVQFAQAATGTLKLDSSANFTGTVSNFGAGNQLDLADIGFAAGASMSYAENQQGTGGTLTVSDGSHTANITLLGQFATDGFQATDDHHAGTLITYHPPIA